MTVKSTAFKIETQHLLYSPPPRRCAGVWHGAWRAGRQAELTDCWHLHSRRMRIKRSWQRLLFYFSAEIWWIMKRSCQAPSFIECNMFALCQPLSAVAGEGHPGTFPPYPEQHFLLTQTDPCWCLFALIKPHRGRSSDTRLWLVCFALFLVFLLPFSSVKSIWLYNFSVYTKWSTLPSNPSDLLSSNFSSFDRQTHTKHEHSAFNAQKGPGKIISNLPRHVKYTFLSFTLCYVIF